MATINICESVLEERIKDALHGGEHFKYVSGCLEQELKGLIEKGY